MNKSEHLLLVPFLEQSLLVISIICENTYGTIGGLFHFQNKKMIVRVTTQAKLSRVRT